MKKLNYLLAALVVLAITVGCKKEVNVALNKTTMEVVAEGETFEIALTSNGDWTATSGADWISVMPASGNGDATLTITIAGNDESESRSGDVTVTTKDNSVKLTVTQGARQNYLSINPPSIESVFEGGTYEVSVISNCDWTVNISVDWVTCSPTSGTNNGNVVFTVNPITDETNYGRETDVTIVSDQMDATLHILQKGLVSMPIEVDPTQVLFTYHGGSETVAVRCEGSWTVETEVDWISLSVNSGTGDSNLTINALESEILEPRVTIITFTSEEGNTATLWVHQEAAPDPHFLEVTPLEIQFGKEGGSANVNIACDTEWEFFSDCDWLSLSQQTGTGNATITLTAEPNPMAEPRMNAFRINSGELSFELTVQQEAGDEPLVAAVDPEMVSVAYTGGVVTVSVMSNTSWQLLCSDWITLMTSYGEGDASLSIIVDSNQDPNERTGFVNVLHGGQILATLTIVQEGKQNILETEFTELEVHPEGGTYIINVTANQAWTVGVDVAWLHCDPMSGFANGSITLTVDPLVGVRPREGHIKLSGSDGSEVIIHVNQHQ